MKACRIKLILLTGLILIAGCNITFKKKSSEKVDSQIDVAASKKIDDEKTLSSKTIKSGTLFTNKDKELINLFYNDKANAVILKDMIAHTRLSIKQRKKLTESKNVANSVQVMPLPLELERMLSPLPRNILRVQVDRRIILMDVNSRRILDVIKI